MPVSEFVLPDKAKKPHYHGHRERLRERFQKDGPKSLPDYGLLELILFGALRRGDIKPLAKRLIEQFDTLAGVLSVDVDALQTAGLGETTIDYTPVYPREVLKRTLELGATVLILVHNHPSGNATPSRAEIEMTQQINAVAKPLGNRSA